MRSSTSNSETVSERLPRLPWSWLIAGTMLVAAAFVGAMEGTLAVRGFRATIVDSEAQWLKQRERAAALGDRALILVGDSRVLTDLDLDVLHDRTGLIPVELGIDGSSFAPVLAGLARDAHITGHVIVGFSDAELLRRNEFSAADRYESDFERRSGQASGVGYAVIEDALKDHLHTLLASYADGARPLTTLVVRVLNATAAPQYTMTLPDRSRVIDYTRANARSLGDKSAFFELDGTFDGLTNTTLDARERILRERIDTLQPADAAEYASRSADLEGDVRAMRKRSADVAFVVFPIVGYIAEIDARRYPRARFWDVFAAHSGARCIHFADDAALRAFAPADGLHLDGSDRERFTSALVYALGLAR